MTDRPHQASGDDDALGPDSDPLDGLFVGYESPASKLPASFTLDELQQTLTDYLTPTPLTHPSGSIVPPAMRRQRLERICQLDLTPDWLSERLREYVGRSRPEERPFTRFLKFPAAGALAELFWPEHFPLPKYAGLSRRYGYDCHALEIERPVSMFRARWLANRIGRALGLLTYADALYEQQGERGVRLSIIEPLGHDCWPATEAPAYEVWEPVEPTESRWALVYSHHSLEVAFTWRRKHGSLRSIIRDRGEYLAPGDLLDGTPAGGVRFRRSWDVLYLPRLSDGITAEMIDDRHQAKTAPRSNASKQGRLSR